MRRQPWRVRALAITTATALIATPSACGTGVAAREPGAPIELSIATFTEFGYEDLLIEYQENHPGIKVRHQRTGQGGTYHQQLFTRLGAGSGLTDVVAVEEGHLSDALAASRLFHDLAVIGPREVTGNRWLDWKYAAAKAKDGSLIGYGTDIGPLAMCYRVDLFAAAGLPTDPELVKPLFTSWDTYFAAGDDYVARTGQPWFDSAGQIFNAMHNQLATGYFDTDDTLVVASNPAIKQNWDAVTAAARRGQSAGLTAFSAEWEAGFRAGAFATKTCPSWMLGVIKAQAGPANAGRWAVTDAFPGGGGNWGGSYLAVPKQSAHPKEAAALAAWLTAPEQQIRAFARTGNFPSQVEALTSPRLLGTVDEYFGGAHTGALFAAQARKVSAPQYKGPGDGRIQEAVATPALRAVEQGTAPEVGWRQLVEGAEKIAR
ncbi:ABC transporter substrate-binding protein [Actinokineospora globicatena]|uniref:Sugar ABC transporter substrate-binding protein n=1 Tax=Actinokineospora globicatena TaxID=103729 RepID=A0A9W6V9U1_9PSEU|nr:ABC transporter substrate-binding protein [Actinokineospora globicatena]GLW91308.1 sugar ABC transporter substrate-binding protein [Actinokineospora globicatena]